MENILTFLQTGWYWILIGIAVLFAAKKKIWKKLPKISFRRKKKDSLLIRRRRDGSST